MSDDFTVSSNYAGTAVIESAKAKVEREYFAFRSAPIRALFYFIDCCYVIRVFSCLNGAFLVWCLASTQTAPTFWRIRVAIISFCALGSAFSLNDVIDVQEDRINSATRPVAADRVGKKVALLIYSLLSAIAIYLGLTLHSRFGSCIAVVMVVLASVYSFVIKPLWPLKNLIAAVMVTSLPIFAWSFNSPLLIGRRMGFAIILFFWSWEKELLADIRDLAGDARSGLMTLPRRIGAMPTLLLIGMLNLCLWLSICASIRPARFVFTSFLFLASLHTAILVWCVAISSPKWLKMYLRTQIALTSLGLAVTAIGWHLYR